MITTEFFEAVDRQEHFSAYFMKESDAKEAAKGNGFYGSDASVVKHTIRIYDSVEEWKRMTLRTVKDPDLLKVLKKLPQNDVIMLQKHGLNIEYT